MNRQILRDWVNHYGTGIVSALVSLRFGGRLAVLTAVQTAESKALTIKGSDRKKDKVVRWRCVDLREEAARRFTVSVTERTIDKWLRTLELTREQPRSFHLKRDAAVQEAFKETPEPDLGRTSVAGKPIATRFGGEARVYQKGTHRTYLGLPSCCRTERADT